MKKSKILASILSAIMALTLLAGCGPAKKDEQNNGGSDEAKKISITIHLTLEDNTSKDYKLNVTDGVSLRKALFEGGLIGEDDLSSMFVTTIDGNTADAVNDGVTWALCDESNEPIQKSMDDTMVADGETYYIMYYVVPDMD